MADRSEQEKRGFALSKPGDPLGVSCDENGPRLGPVRLLEKGAWGFSPRPAEDLDAILSAAFGEAMSSASLLAGLEAVARALDAKDMARAIFATQYLRLPELTEQQARRASVADALRKAAVDDEDHPGWPKDTPGGKGGQFRPKDMSAGDGGVDHSAVILAQAARAKTIEKTNRRLARRTVRTLLKSLLNWKRIFRLASEAGSNVVPGADIVGDAALIADIAEAAGEYEQLMAEADAAIDFIKNGPYSLEELQATAKYEDFLSFDEFKKTDLEKVFGSAGDGQEWHHIVEQGIKDDAITIRELQSTTNIIRLPKALHEMITSEYSSLIENGNVTLRNSLKGGSFDERRAVGLNVLKNLGILKD